MHFSTGEFRFQLHGKVDRSATPDHFRFRIHSNRDSAYNNPRSQLAPITDIEASRSGGNYFAGAVTDCGYQMIETSSKTELPFTECRLTGICTRRIPSPLIVWKQLRS